MPRLPRSGRYNLCERQKRSLDPAKHAASVHGVLSCKDCHTSITDYPHPAKVALVKCASCHEEEASHLQNSVHSALGDGACPLDGRRKAELWP